MIFDDKTTQLENTVKEAQDHLNRTRELVELAQGSDQDVNAAIRDLEEAEYRLSRHLLTDQQEDQD